MRLRQSALLWLLLCRSPRMESVTANQWRIVMTWGKKLESVQTFHYTC